MWALLVKTLITFVKIVRYLISATDHRSWLTSWWLSGFGVSLWLPYLSSSCNPSVLLSPSIFGFFDPACHFINFRTFVIYSSNICCAMPFDGIDSKYIFIAFTNIVWPCHWPCHWCAVTFHVAGRILSWRSGGSSNENVMVTIVRFSVDWNFLLGKIATVWTSNELRSWVWTFEGWEYSLNFWEYIVPDILRQF